MSLCTVSFLGVDGSIRSFRIFKLRLCSLSLVPYVLELHVWAKQIWSNAERFRYLCSILFENLRHWSMNMRCRCLLFIGSADSFWYLANGLCPSALTWLPNFLVNLRYSHLLSQGTSASCRAVLVFGMFYCHFYKCFLN